MLDIAFIRENPDKVKEGIKNKNFNPEIVDKVIASDVKRRELIQQIEAIRAERNKLNEELKSARTPELISKSSELKEKLQAIEPDLKEAETELLDLLYQVPNIAEDSVPLGKDESENVIVKTVGEPTHFDFIPKDHMALGEDLDIIDTETAAKVTGSRFAYLKGDAALLEYAIVQYVFRTLSDPVIIKQIADSVKPGYNPKPFVPVVPPVMIKPEVFRRMARLTDADKDERYYLQQDDAFLIGSAEHTLGPIHIDSTLSENQLPIRYIGFSTSFRREAGSYGKDTKGIFRVHQFDKLEMESFTTPEDSHTEQDFIVAVQEYLVHSMGIPYQLVAICTGDMGKPDARQIDINSWFPSQGKYRETHTSDLMTDYQARRLETKIRRNNGEIQYAHMNDATAIAIGRFLIAILENYQQKDGSVKIPDVLVPFIGKTEIKRG